MLRQIKTHLRLITARVLLFCFFFYNKVEHIDSSFFFMSVVFQFRNFFEHIFDFYTCIKSGISNVTFINLLFRICFLTRAQSYYQTTRRKKRWLYKEFTRYIAREEGRENGTNTTIPRRNMQRRTIIMFSRQFCVRLNSIFQHVRHI